MTLTRAGKSVATAENLTLSPDLRASAETLFRNEEFQVRIQTDQHFFWLFLIQWMGGIILCCSVSPVAWQGSTMSIHEHLMAAVGLGGLIISFPMVLIRLMPGCWLTRHAVAAAQMLFGALLIHLTGGRIETHFHVFGSLAFLAFYRDPRVLITATMVVGLDHWLRSVFWPESVFGVRTGSLGRVLEHVGWVVFENAFLCWSIALNRRGMRALALRQAKLEEAHERIQEQVVERQRTEERLRESERQLRTAIAKSPIPAMIYDEEGAIRFLSQGWTDSSGYSPEEIPTLSDWMTKAYGERSTVASAHPDQRFAISKPVRDGERVIWAKDGAQRIWDIYTTPLGQDNAGTRLLMGQAVDLTERKRAEAACARLAAIVESSEDAILSKALDGTITSWNQGASRLFGYTADEVIGQPVSVLIPPERLDEDAQILARLQRGERVNHFETVRRCKDGRLVDVALTVSPIRDGAGRIIGASKIARDVTARRAAEQLQLENVRLEARSRQVEEANRLKSEFLANMSHELRTPLNAILGFSEMLIDQRPGPLNPKQAEYLGDVYSSATHLLQLINGVLDLAKVEAGKMELNLEPFALERAILEVWAVVQGIADKKGIALRWAVTPELGSITLDPQKFKQVCYNLLSNAVKFTEPGGRVEINASASGDDRFELRVKDTGLGIKPEDLPRLFREFEQLDGGASRRFEGTGLGLALTKRLVELQGGSIRVESQWGKGSTFSVVLPRHVSGGNTHA